MIDEEDVRLRVYGKLVELGYTRLSPREPGGKGPDLKVRHHDYSSYFIVESKGSPGGNALAANMESAVRDVLFQINHRYTSTRGRNYGIGVPAEGGFQRRIITKLAREKSLRFPLHLFIVRESGSVVHLKPREVNRRIGIRRKELSRAKGH